MNFFNSPKRNRKPFFPLLVLAMVFVAGALVMLLWNYILPEVANVKPLNYWQAVGLFVLCKILFGFGGGKPNMHRRPRPENRMPLTDEDKEKLREEWRQRFKR